MEALDVYGCWTYGVPVEKLKEWLDKQIAEGATHIETKLDWGYYNDISEITLVPNKY